MEKINKLLATSRTTEVDAVSNRIITEYKKNDWSSDTHLTGIFDELESTSLKLTHAINRGKSESNLEEKDEVRDNKVRAIHYLIQGFEHHPDETIREAARAVDNVFERYGVRIVQESYASQSSLIESLLDDFANPDLQPFVDALPGFSQVLTELQTAQTEFEEAKVTYEAEKAEEGTKENATLIKMEVLKIINDKLVVYLRAMIQVNEAVYGSFARTVAQIINDMNVIVRKRRKNNNGDAGE